MPQGDKGKYTEKQIRKAEHIADSYASRGVPDAEAEARAWATVNKDDGGGKKPGGSGRGKAGGNAGKSANKSAGKSADKTAGGKASAARTAEQRSASPRKAAATRKANRGA